MQRTYVEAVSRLDVAGNLTLLSIAREDGRTFKINRALDSSIKVPIIITIGGTAGRALITAGGIIIQLCAAVLRWFPY